MSYKDSVRQCVSTHVCVRVHVHNGKPVSTSNRGPNQHPIAHPHNPSLYLSIFCSSYFHSLSPSHGLASAFFRSPLLLLPFPLFLLLPRDGSRGGGGGGDGGGDDRRVYGWGRRSGRRQGRTWTRQVAQAPKKPAFIAYCALSGGIDLSTL